MPRYEVPVVFDVEEEPPRPLGIYKMTEEDTVIYRDPYGFVKHAPQDCVKVVTCVVKVP